VLPDFPPRLYLPKCSQIGQKSGQIFHQTLENSVARFYPPLASNKIFSDLSEKRPNVSPNFEKQCYQIFYTICICQNVLRWAKKVAKFFVKHNNFEKQCYTRFFTPFALAKMFSDRPKKRPNFLSNTTTLENSVTRFYPPFASDKTFSDLSKSGQNFCQTQQMWKPVLQDFLPSLISAKMFSDKQKKWPIFLSNTTIL
jgi:hypothetical protein